MPVLNRILATPNWILRPLPVENRHQPALNVQPPPIGQAQLRQLAADSFPVHHLELALCPATAMLCMLRATPPPPCAALVHPLHIDLFVDAWYNADETTSVCSEQQLTLWLDPRPAADHGIHGLNTLLVSHGSRISLHRQEHRPLP